MPGQLGAPGMLRCSVPTLVLTIIAFTATFAFSPVACCSSGLCQVLDPCLEAADCGAGLYCGNCPATGEDQPICTRGQAIQPSLVVGGLPFNRYSWLMTHNSFSILNEQSHTESQRVTFYNQEDSVTNQLMNGVRGLMLDMYDFEGDIWLCHSFQGHCFNFTAFEPAINTLKEVEAFLTQNPSEIVTIIIEDYVRSPKGLTQIFTDAGLLKYWFPVSEMPTNGGDWPTVTDMVTRNHRLLVFTSDASKEANEGIAYQWKYMVENEHGDPGIIRGLCPNRKESLPLNSRSASLFLMNYFPTIPVLKEACKEHSYGLPEMVGTCYKAAAGTMPNFIAVNFYMRSNGGGVFDTLDSINGFRLCACNTVTACQVGLPAGACRQPNRSTSLLAGTYSGFIQFKVSSSSTINQHGLLWIHLLCFLSMLLSAIALCR